MTNNRVLLAALSLGILIGLLVVAEGMRTSPNEQTEAMPAVDAFKAK